MLDRFFGHSRCIEQVPTLISKVVAPIDRIPQIVLSLHRETSGVEMLHLGQRNLLTPFHPLVVNKRLPESSDYTDAKPGQLAAPKTESR